MVPPDLDLAETFRRVPAEGIDLWSLGFVWADPAPIALPGNAGEDLVLLASQGVTTVRGLLGTHPSTLIRDGRMSWENLAAYRLVARWALVGATIGAHQHLIGLGWSQTELERMSAGLKHAVAESVASGDPVPVVVQMADVMTGARLAEYDSPAERIAARQRHADETQQPVIAESEIGRDVGLRSWLGNQFFALLTPEQIRRVARQRSVRRISPQLNVRAALDQAMPRIQTTALRAAASGAGEVVAVLDSGVDDQHPDLSGRVVRKRDYTGRGHADEYGHGTHMAGIIGARHHTYSGVAPDATIWSYRILDHAGSGVGEETIKQALQDVLADAATDLGHEMFVINCSFEVPISYANADDDFDTFCEPFDDATAQAVVVAAAGNAGPEPASITAPGGGTSVLAVGASVSRPASNVDVVSYFSSRGPATQRRRKPDVVAPGGFTMPQGAAHAAVSVVSSRAVNSTLDRQTSDERPWQVDTGHYGLSGTSQAAAIVSGLAAVLLEEGRRRGRALTHAEIAHALRSTARPLGYGRYEQGHGLVQGDAALRAL
jgi:subtilisin family serine protease